MEIFKLTLIHFSKETVQPALLLYSCEDKNIINSISFQEKRMSFGNEGDL